MKMYRLIGDSIPESYIDYHRSLAEASIQNYSKAGIVSILEDLGEKRDVYGMRSRMYKVAAKIDGEWTIETIAWHDSHGEGAWFKKGAGWIRFLEE